jgi:hypothetical protein
MWKDDRPWWFFCLLLLLLNLPGCGGGGSGGGGGDEGNSGAGWISITNPVTASSPAANGYYRTDPGQKMLELGGEVFVSPKWVRTAGESSTNQDPPYENCRFIVDCLINVLSNYSTDNVDLADCDGPPCVPEEVGVRVRNETLDVTVIAEKSPSGGVWQSMIPLTPGDNRLRVRADDLAGNRGEIQIVVNVPEPPYVAPPRDISATALSSGIARYYRSAANSNGDAVVVWREYGSLFAAIHRSVEGWSKTAQLTDWNSSVLIPRVAIDRFGRALVVWSESFPGGEGCNETSEARLCEVSRYYQPGKGWSERVVVAMPQFGYYSGSTLLMDYLGNALLFLGGTDSDGQFVRVARYAPSSGWFDVDINYSGMDLSPGRSHIVSDRKGGGMAVWQYFSRIYFSRYSADSGWSADTNIGSATNQGNDCAWRHFGTDTRFGGPRIALSSSGNRVAAWIQESGDHVCRLFANYYREGSGWGGPVVIESVDGDVYHLSAAIDAAGNALVVWAQGDGDNREIRANRYSPGTGWGSDYAISSDEAAGVGLPAMAMSESGDAVAVWTRSDGWARTVVGRKYGAMEWRAAEALELDSAEGASDPNVTMAAGDEALVTWIQYANVWDPVPHLFQSSVPDSTTVYAGFY